MSSRLHVEFLKEIKNIMTKLNPQINEIEFKYGIVTKRGSLIESIDLLVQINDILIIFECKLNKNYRGKSKQLDKHKDNIIKLKNRLLNLGSINKFNRIIRLYVINDQNLIINVDTNLTMDIYNTFNDNPKLVLQ